MSAREGEVTLTEDRKGHHYDATSITVLEGLEAVRKRPAMYIGDIGVRGLHHLIWEVVDHSVDEALAGYCTEVSVTVETEGSIAVRDNGEIWMDRHQVDLREVRGLIERMHVERPEDTVVIVADKQSRAGIVAQVMDEVRAGGIKDVALGAAPGSGG